MKRLHVVLLALLVALCAPAHACKPSSLTAIRYSTTLDGAWAYWWCTSNVYTPRAILWSSVTEPLRSRAKAYMLGNDPTFIDLTPSLSIDDPSLAALVADMKLSIAADTDRPPALVVVPWIVTPNGALPDRAMFPLVAGKRSFASSGRTPVRAVVPAPVLTEGATSYCLVAPLTVAPCSKP